MLFRSQSDHSHDQEGYTHPSDIWHQMFGPSVTLRLSENDEEFEDWRVLDAYLNVAPHSEDPAERVPHAALEFTHGVWTPALAPAAFAEVINRLAAHVDQLRVMHTQLVAAVAEHAAGDR